MQKRRERIEKWRAEKNKTKELLPINIAPPSKKWSLEDEDDDEDENVDTGTKADDDNEVDPLDAYMQVRLSIDVQFTVLVVITFGVSFAKWLESLTQNHLPLTAVSSPGTLESFM